MTFTELRLYTDTVTRTIVKFCTYGLATVNTTETIEASVGNFFWSVATLKCKKYIHLFYLNKSKDKTNRQREGTVIPPSPTFTLRNLIEVTKLYDQGDGVKTFKCYEL